MWPCLSIAPRGAHSASVNEAQRKRELGLDTIEEFRDADAVEQVAQARALAIGAVAVLGEDAQHRRRDRDAFVGADEQAAVLGEAVDGR